MDTVVLDDIRFDIDAENLRQRLHIADDDAASIKELGALLDEARKIARPKAICKVAFIEERGDDFVIADGIRFDSRVLAVNVRDVHRLFPFAATCGIELEEWSRTIKDLLHQFWADAIKVAALQTASSAVREHMNDLFLTEPSSCMNPGSLPDWPLEQQCQLFRLLDDPEKSIGITLTESCLMVPVKSISGLRFSSDADFRNCQLCPRKVCPGRSAPYDPALWDRKYR